MTGRVVVEFCGLPGTGKTALAGSVRDAVAERGIACSIADEPLSAAASRSRRIARKATAAALEATRRPAATVDAGWRALTSRQESARDAAAWLGQWLAVRQAVARARRQPGVHLVEEGVVQSLWTLGLRARRDVVGRLLERTPSWVRGDLLVVVEAPTELVLERLGARSSRHSRTQQLAPEARADELRRGELLLAELADAGGVPILRLRNDRSDGLSQLARQVADRALASSPSRWE
jgi:hypothetical protein